MDTPMVAMLLAWGLVVGMDLVSVGQVMANRPLVAGSVAGLILGDPVSGMMVGVILELFALEVLPLGASRYPDYGLGAIAGAATASGSPGILGIGLGIGVALLVAWLGEVSMSAVRRFNSSDVRRRRERLDRGDVGTITRVHLRGLLRDAIRAVGLAAAGLLLAQLARRWSPVDLETAVLVTIVAIGIALATAVHAAVRLSGGGRGVGWLATGIVAGTLWVVLL
jgi:PTS system mannose-specific IIC component